MLMTRAYLRSPFSFDFSTHCPSIWPKPSKAPSSLWSCGAAGVQVKTFKQNKQTKKTPLTAQVCLEASYRRPLGATNQGQSIPAPRGPPPAAVSPPSSPLPPPPCAEASRDRRGGEGGSGGEKALLGVLSPILGPEAIFPAKPGSLPEHAPGLGLHI